jgi:hypothetical protein
VNWEFVGIGFGVEMMSSGDFAPAVMGDDAGLIPALPDDVAMQCLLRVPPCSHAQSQRVSRRWRELVNSSQYYEERKREGTSEKFECMLQAMEPLQLASAGKATSQRSPVFGITLFNVQQRTRERLPPIPDFSEGLPIFSRYLFFPSILAPVLGTVALVLSTTWFGSISTDSLGFNGHFCHFFGSEILNP